MRKPKPSARKSKSLGSALLLLAEVDTEQNPHRGFDIRSSKAFWRIYDIKRSGLTLFALREAQLILADHVQLGPRDSEKTIQQLLEVLDRGDMVEAMERLTVTGVRLA
jgi:hypothetical protein